MTEDRPTGDDSAPTDDPFEDAVKRALDAGPMDWPDDDAPPVDDGLPHGGLGMPPAGGGAMVSGGWESRSRGGGADTDTPDRHDEDEDNER